MYSIAWLEGVFERFSSSRGIVTLPLLQTRLGDQCQLSSCGLLSGILYSKSFGVPYFY